MKLDRNVNENGLGKYALVEMRKLSAAEKVQFNRKTEDIEDEVSVPRRALNLGDPDQFFVLKYKDRFTLAAMEAYAEAVRSYASHEQMSDEEMKDLLEYYRELQDQIRMIRSYPPQIPD
jgi:hypothetical protein